jgi:hypothetical protein
MVPGLERRLRLDFSLYLAVFVVVVSAISWSIVIWGIRRGIDLTDEGFYLNSISLPFSYKVTYTQFGFILYPIYVLVGGDLIQLRLVGLLSLTSAAVYFVSTVLRLPLVHPPLPKMGRLVLAVGGSCAVLLEYFPWTPTPNYNLLNLFGVLVVFSGWLRILATSQDAALPSRYRVSAVVVFAVGFMVVTLVKPTTAPVLAIGLSGLTLPFGRRALTDVVCAGAFSFLLVVLALLAIDGDLSTLISRYRNSLIYIQLSQSGHDLSSSFAFGAEALTGVFGACLLGSWLKYGRGADPRTIVVFAALIFAPFAIAFGTNTGLLKSAPRAGVFWVVAIALFIIVAAPPNIRLRSFYFTMALCACAVLIVLAHAIQKPYRINGPLWQQTEWVSSMTKERLVKVDPATADYFRTLQTGARSAGFRVGTPIIDLTGMGPTSIYMLGGEAVGAAWINGGYPGSRNVTMLALSTVPSVDLRRSWILTAPSGHGHLPTDILNDVGLRFPDDYEEVTHAQTSFMSEQQVLWRPRESGAPPTCSSSCVTP